MAITMNAAQQTDAYRFFAIAFNAAPGVEYMNQIAEAYIGGADTKQIVNAFTTKSVFTTAYPLFLTNEQFAIRLVSNVVGATASDSAKLAAQIDIVTALNGGATRGDVIFQIFSNLASLTGDATWGGTAAKLANQVAVARYYTETLGRTSTDTATLQAVLAGVGSTTDVSEAALAARLNPPAAVVAKTMPLTSGVDSGAAFVGTSAADTYVVGTLGNLAAYDTINGAGGDDTLVVTVTSTTGLADTAFTTVSSVEKLNLFYSTSGQNPAATNHSLGAKAAAAGLKSVSLLGDAQNLNLTGFNAALSVTGTDFAETVTLSLADAGDKSLLLGLGAKTLNVAAAAADTAGSTKVSFVSADVGNGVGMVKIDGANGDITTENTGITIIGDQADQFNVIGSDSTGALVEAQNRGNFRSVLLGSASADSLNTSSGLGNVYINAGSGDDTLSATANTGSRHFLVGGAGKDAITVATLAQNNTTGSVVVLAGDGDDGVVVDGFSDGLESINGGAGNDTVTYKIGTAGPALNGVAAANDTLDGGDGVDTLVITSQMLATTPAPGTTGVRSISNFEALTVSNQLSTTKTLSDVQAGLATVNLSGGATGQVGLTFDAGVAGSVNLGGVLGGAFTVATAGSGTSDTVTVSNAKAATAATSTTPATADNVFNGANLSGSGVETLVLNGTGTGSPTAGTQTIGVISLTGSGTTTQAATTVRFEGSVAFEVASVNATNLDASALSAKLTASTAARNVLSGSGNDVLTFVGVTAAAQAATANTAAVPAQDATISSGAGNDSITINSTGDGQVNVVVGDGNDTVNVAGRGTSKLNVSLGAGSDVVTVAQNQAINATDTIDAGAGTDTLQLNIVGAANIGAFSNFEVFDAKSLDKTLDVEILASRNTVTEFISTGDVGAASLLNVGAGVGYRVTGTAANSTMSLTQKTAGALTVTLDVDQQAPTQQVTNAGAGVQTAAMSVTATNATSVNVVFDSSYLADSATTPDRDLSTITLNAGTQTTNTLARVSVTSGGANSFNTLNVSSTVAPPAAGTALSVSGDRPLALNTLSSAVLSSIDGSAATGGLTVSTAALRNGATLSLGSGVDLVTVGTNSSVGTPSSPAFEKISGFEKAAAAAVVTATQPTTAQLDAQTAAIADTDKLVLTGLTNATVATVAGANNTVTTGTISNGVLSFTGAGPATLADAFAIANLAADANGEALVFQYLGNSYVFVQDPTADIVVELTGVTGVTSFVGTGTNSSFYIV